MILDLRQIDSTASLSMKEITGQATTTPTTCAITRTAEGVTLRVRCDDPNMRELVATAPDRRRDHFLYEEDCLQMTVAQSGDAEPRGFLLLNAMNKRTAAGQGESWRSAVARDAAGWTATIHLPIDAALPGVGLSLHRYFRGLRHEVQSFTQTLPHPLDTRTFIVLATHPRSQLPAVAEDYERTVERGQKAALELQLRHHRARLAAAKAGTGRKASLDTAKHFAKLRMQQPVGPHTGHLCWNEGHFLRALADLYALDGEVAWIEHACERVEAMWRLRADRVGRVDGVFGFVRPTWYEAGMYSAMCLVTGAILDPITQILRLVMEDDALESLRPRAQPWIELSRQCIETHDDEWLDLPDGCGMFLEPYDKGPRRVYPTGGSRVCPLNRAFFPAMAMLRLGRLTGDSKMLQRVEAMARYFEGMSELLDDGSLVWEYEEGRYPAVGEDTSHAACQMTFVELCAAEGVVFDESHLRAMATTLKLQLLKHGDVACGTVRGLEPGLDMATAAWAPLCRFEPKLLPAIEAILNVMLHEGKFDCATQGWGVRTLTTLEVARAMIATS